jgi:hypothetical protein
VIRTLCRATEGRWAAPAVSRQKKEALLGLAGRIAVVAEEYRSGEVRAPARAAKTERRKALRIALGLVAEGSDAETIARSLAALPAFKEPDPGTALELCVTLSGVAGMLAGEHPYILMRKMSAYLGSELFDKAEAWILARLKRRRYRTDSLVPGELPDVVRSLALDRRCLERALRAAGREIAAAALAGCPQESMDLVKPLYGAIGGAAIEDDAAYLRVRLSGDEISEAQTAFLEIVRSLEERGELELGDEDELSTDPAFVNEFTKAILALDEKLVRAAMRGVEGGILAVAMQGMEPSAHDRILGSLSKKEERRILDAIDGADPLPRRAIHEAGRWLAERLIAAASPGGAPEGVLKRLVRVRDWDR